MSGEVYRFRARLLHRLGLHTWRYHVGVPNMNIVRPATRREWHSVGGAVTWRTCTWCGVSQTRRWDKQRELDLAKEWPEAENGGSSE